AAKTPARKRAVVRKSKPIKLAKPKKVVASKGKLSKKTRAVSKTLRVRNKPIRLSGNGAKKASTLSRSSAKKVTPSTPITTVTSQPPSRLRQQLPPPPPPPLPKPEPRKTATAAALRAFEQALKVFNRRHYEEAKSLFESLPQRFPQEVEILHRAQMYI